MTELPDHQPPSVPRLWVALAVVWLAVPLTGIVVGALTEPLSSGWWYGLIGLGLAAGSIVLWRWISLQQPPEG
ncbi:hypothetical protein DJ010_20340 [Nocardioides silvaticus]|uniref:DUF2530 domain-containing protein n=1 Tax=Nocardioides silvaticus TaxID=2201891 RepID=A0A316TAC1_9ACTN|nr:hypothetical protein [Nocardioides silvaticus]PWN01187.1 hypothetical protein DJ010_20340 [Nocardioides silvaticus]